MEEEELSAKRFKSNSLDEVLEIFSSFKGPAPPPNSSMLPVIKQEVDMDEHGRQVDKLEDRYSHILVKETLVNLDDGINALVGESFGRPSEEACDDANEEEGAVIERSQVLKQLEELKRNLRRKLAENEGKYRKLEKQYEDLKSKSGLETDDEWESKANAVLKSKQDRILVLEREMERKMQESSDCGDDSLISIDSSLFLKLVNFLKDEKERANSIKGLLGASVGKLKNVKEKEDQLKKVRVENERLSTSLIDIEAKSRDLLKNIDILSEEVKSRDQKIEMLKETNANLEQEVNLGLVDMDSSKVGDITEVMQNKVKERDNEISNLNKRLSTLTSESVASQTFSNRIKTLLKQTEDELTILKEKQSCHDELLQKYETRLCEKDQEINSLKRQSSLNDLKSEFTMYFNELDRKSQQFMNLVKEQQDEIETLKNQKMMWERSKSNPVPLPVTQPMGFHPHPRRFLRPVRSQVPYRVQSSPPQLYNAPNTIATQPVPSNSGLSLFDQAPRYYSGQPPQQPQNRTFQPSPVPGESLLSRTLPQEMAGEMPVLEGPFSFE